MLVKEVKPINFIFYRTETTVDNLINLVPIAKELFKEAVQLQLHITGPIHWHYFGFTDNQKPFTLEIALPVSAIVPDYDGKLHFKRSEPFKCVTTIHEGGWNEIPSSYNKMMQFITKHKMEPSMMNREIYINSDFQNPDANVTEIQIGIY
ncbi:GyrI-like domain-containing protein [Chryseolinea sp. H1M3-3]|uniref:GyrI-like domain-containing protein n=1 Tax=Chryseolinea sp. H1M3-3 TaxID=3034144 RepID=UPI0023ECB264|nr:GyrI-like domain-containing protein [Chryseolinea sp. H1M3-3]